MATATLKTERTSSGEAARQRVQEILRTEIDFIPNPEFRADDDGENEIVAATLRDANSPGKAPAELPAHLRR